MVFSPAIGGAFLSMCIPLGVSEHQYDLLAIVASSQHL